METLQDCWPGRASYCVMAGMRKLCLLVCHVSFQQRRTESCFTWKKWNSGTNVSDVSGGKLDFGITLTIR